MKKAILLAASVLIASCANIQESAVGSANPNSSMAYLTVSFLNSYRESFARLAIEVSCDSEPEPLHIELQQPGDHAGIELFPIAPGECLIKGLGRMGGVGDLGDVVPLYSPELSRPFRVEAGSIYYIGHYDGKTTNDVTSAGMMGGFVWVSANKAQAVEAIGITQPQLAVEVAALYPHFSSMEIIEVFDFAKVATN